MKRKTKFTILIVIVLALLLAGNALSYAANEIYIQPSYTQVLGITCVNGYGSIVTTYDPAAPHDSRIEVRCLPVRRE